MEGLLKILPKVAHGEEAKVALCTTLLSDLRCEWWFDLADAKSHEVQNVFRLQWTSLFLWKSQSDLVCVFIAAFCLDPNLFGKELWSQLMDHFLERLSQPPTLFSWTKAYDLPKRRLQKIIWTTCWLFSFERPLRSSGIFMYFYIARMFRRKTMVQQNVILQITAYDEAKRWFLEQRTSLVGECPAQKEWFQPDAMLRSPCQARWLDAC